MRTAIVAATAVLGSVLLGAQEAQTPRFRVAIDAVRIDAVVTDKDGKIVPDLVADDFELLQDGKKQKVTFAQFVPVDSAAAPAPAAAPDTLASKNVVGAPPAPRVPVRRENIQRTLAIVVDDLSLSVESLYYVKRSLHTFVDEALAGGDLVALVRTGGSLDGLQPFTTDRRVLHAAIDNLQWNTFSRNAVESFAPANEFVKIADGSHGPQAGPGTSIVTADFASLNAFRGQVTAAGAIGSINLVIEGARSMPGRKAMLLVTEGFDLLERRKFDPVAAPGRVRTALDRAIDRATRAGVVIYSIDARGLQALGTNAGDNFNCPPPGCPQDAFESKVRGTIEGRNAEIRDTQQGMAYLAEQTGGFAVLNTNNLAGGLARAARDVRDYYVIGYAPESSTFAAKGKTPELHKINVRVKRPGLKVRTRKTFLGVSDEDRLAAAETPAQQLVNAAISPFAATDIAVRATTLPGYSAERGLFARALLHIDAGALTFAKDESGKPTASADVLGMVFDKDGTEIAHLSTGLAASVSSEAAQGAIRDGIAYTLRIPIPRAGPYQVRFAVRDRASGKVGTAGEFVEIPDVPGGVFALSGIVLRSENDLALPGDADRVVISPSQAVRVYKPGANLKYACEIYNATAPVQLAISVWRGNERVLTGAPDTLTPPSAKDRWFAASGAFKLGEALAPGRYVLQIAAQTTDAKNKGRVSRALQQMDFEVK